MCRFNEQEYLSLWESGSHSEGKVVISHILLVIEVLEFEDSDDSDDQPQLLVWRQ